MQLSKTIQKHSLIISPSRKRILRRERALIVDTEGEVASNIDFATLDWRGLTDAEKEAYRKERYVQRSGSNPPSSPES